MEHLWSGGEGDAKAVHAALGKRRGITLSTIQSTLKRLHEKELLERDKVSHAHVYRPTGSREQFQRSTLGELVGELMGGEADAMVAAFVDLTERVARLEALVAERRKRLARRPR